MNLKPISCLLAMLLLVPCFPAFAQEAEGVIYLDNIKNLPQERVLWKDEVASNAPKKTHEIFRDLEILENGNIAFLGQLGGLENSSDPSAAFYVYSPSGELMWSKSHLQQGYQSYMSGLSDARKIWLLGDYSEPQSDDEMSWSGNIQMDDKVMLRVYDLDEQREDAEYMFEGGGAGSIYAPLIVPYKDGAVVKVMARDNVMREQSLVALIQEEDISTGLKPRIFHSDFAVDGRISDMRIDGDVLYIAGSHSNGHAQLLKYNLSEQAGRLANITKEVSPVAFSNISSLLLSGGRVFYAGELNQQAERLGVIGSKNHFFKRLALEDGGYIAAKGLHMWHEKYILALYFVEPSTQNAARYGVISIFDREGRFCEAYRIGDGERENMLPYKSKLVGHTLYIAGARAARLGADLMRNPSLLQKQRYLAYNAYAQSVNLEGLPRSCQAE